MTVLLIILSVLVVIVLLLLYFLAKALVKLLDQDELLQLLHDDIRIANEYYDKLIQTPLLSNSPEVLRMQQNIKIIRARFDEFDKRIIETKGE